MLGDVIYWILLFVIFALVVYILYLKKKIDFEVEKRIGEMKESIRKNALDKSRSVIKGKISEHIAPFMDDFDYNASDARFLGSPVDYVVFDGMGEEAEDIKVVLADVKTGKSNLSSIQRKIKKAVEEGRVVWKTVKLD